jgi:hypothetical protein
MKFAEQKEIVVARFGEQPLLASAVERNCNERSAPHG